MLTTLLWYYWSLLNILIILLLCTDLSQGQFFLAYLFENKKKISYITLVLVIFIYLKMNITIEKDWDWYLAKVVGKDNYFAFWNTQREALIELKKCDWDD